MPGSNHPDNPSEDEQIAAATLARLWEKGDIKVVGVHDGELQFDLTDQGWERTNGR